MIEHVIAAIIAVVLDKLIGDPEHLPHPVRFMGLLINKLDKLLNKGSYLKQKGVIATLIVCTSSFIIPFFIIVLVYEFHLIAGIAVEAFLIYTTIALHDLEKAARRVEVPLLKGDMNEARAKLGWIVGRDTEHLNEQEIVRGTVETVAENTSDGITAPLFYSLFGGAPLAFLYRAANTCDAMLGYKNERYREFGWASARFDDLLNLIPSRLTGWLMAAGNARKVKKPLSELIKKLPVHAHRHPSPNSGWGEGAMALLLGVQLGGENMYEGVVSKRPLIGEAENKLTVEHIDQAVQIMKRTTLLFLLFICIGGAILGYFFA